MFSTEAHLTDMIGGACSAANKTLAAYKQPNLLLCNHFTVLLKPGSCDQTVPLLVVAQQSIMRD